MSGQHTQPCGGCPWTRTVTPGALGGSLPETFIGQVHGPFWLPCHRRCDFSDPNWKTNYATAQCAGAAMYRANLGLQLSPALLQLTENRAAIFATDEEFLAHHKGISIEAARAQLDAEPPGTLLLRQLQRPTSKKAILPNLQLIWKPPPE